jgi:hypothetical protein
MYDGMFIVGIETPDGQATYHYDIDPYWDMFKCRVLDNAPEWDGHTPAQAIERIGKLKAQEPRVMTLEEIKALPDYVFLEDRDISHAFSIKTISRPALPQLVFVNISGEECVGFRGPDGDTSLATSRYGVEWRCWTSRPDEKRRAETPWN